MDSANEQFARMKRWPVRFEEITNGKEHLQSTDFYQDEVYAFFQNCWHLRDWIINSGIIEKVIVDKFFHEDSDMKICRDLANGSKHLTINSPSIDADMKIERKFKLCTG